MWNAQAFNASLYSLTEYSSTGNLSVAILCQKINPPYPIAQTPHIGYNAHKEQPLCLNTQLAQFPKKQ